MPRNPTVTISAVIAAIALILFLTRRGSPFIYLVGIIAAIVLLYAYDWAPRQDKVKVQPLPKRKTPPRDISMRKVLELSLTEARNKAEPLIATTYDPVEGEP